MITILPGTKRPSAVEAMKNGGGYREILAEEGRMTGTMEYRIQFIGHVVCGWNHPTWPDESQDRYESHLTTCELRGEGEAE